MEQGPLILPWKQQVISAPILSHFYPEETWLLFGPKSITTSLTSSLKPKQIYCLHTEPATTEPSFWPGRSLRTGPCKGYLKTTSKCLRSSLTRTLLRTLQHLRRCTQEKYWHRIRPCNSSAPFPVSSTQCYHCQESLPIAPGSRYCRPLTSSI